MLPSKLILVFVLCIVTFASVDASDKSRKDGEEDGKDKPYRRIVRRNRVTSSATTNRNPLKITVPVPSDTNTGVAESVTNPVAKIFSRAVSSEILGRPVMTREEYAAQIRDVGDAYYPVDMAEMERERNSGKEENIMVTLMKRYRQDLGFIEMTEFTRDFCTFEESLAKIKPLLDHFETLNPSELPKMIEAVEFLQDFEKIPSDLHAITSSHWENFRFRFPNSGSFINFYELESKNYHRLNWDLLDLTHFKYQKFPVVGKIFKVFPDEMCYVRNGVITTSGIQHLTKYRDNIRFHNYNTIEGRRMFLFQKLYHLYFNSLGKRRAHPSFIDWNHCTVEGWPEDISKVDLSSWKNCHTTTLMNLIAGNEISFHYSTNNLGGGMLGNVTNFDLISVIEADFAFEKEKLDASTLSDSEEVCGTMCHREHLAESKRLSSERRSAEKKEKRRIEAESKKAEMKKASASAFDDEDEVFTDDYDSSLYAKMASASPRKANITSSRPKTSRNYRKRKPQRSLDIKIDNGRENFSTIKTIPIFGSSVSSTKEDRADLMALVTEIYKRDTGMDGPVDWSAMQLLKVKNHLLPFSTGLESKADIQIVTAMIKHSALAFLSPESELADAQIRTYERVYRVYYEALDWTANHFDVYFEDLDVEGWPEGVSKESTDWTLEDLIVLNAALDAGSIKMKPTPKYQLEIDQQLEILKKGESGDQEEDKELPSCTLNSPVDRFSDVESSSSPKDKRKRSDISIMPKPLTVAAKEQPDVDCDSPKITPGFGTYIGDPIGKLMRGSDEDDETSTTKSKHARMSGEPNAIVMVGECEGSSIMKVNQVRERTRSTASQFIAARAAYSVESRHYCIYSLILDCFRIILQHLDAPFTSAVPPNILIEEASGYLRVFTESLHFIDGTGEITFPDGYYQIFVVSTVRFRARLAGLPLKSESGVVDIKKKNILDRHKFSFLTRNATRWRVDEFQLLEIALILNKPLFQTD